MLSSEVSSLLAKFFTISCNRIRKRIIIQILGKMRQQCLLQSYLCPNCIIVIFYNIQFVCNFLCISIQQKPRSAYPENSGNSATYEAIFTKVDRHQFILRIILNIQFYKILSIPKTCKSIKNWKQEIFTKLISNFQFIQKKVKTYLNITL